MRQVGLLCREAGEGMQQALLLNYADRQAAAAECTADQQ